MGDKPFGDPPTATRWFEEHVCVGEDLAFCAAALEPGFPVKVFALGVGQ